MTIPFLKISCPEELIQWQLSVQPDSTDDRLGVILEETDSEYHNDELAMNRWIFRNFGWLKNSYLTVDSVAHDWIIQVHILGYVWYVCPDDSDLELRNMLIRFKNGIE